MLRAVNTRRKQIGRGTNQANSDKDKPLLEKTDKYGPNVVLVNDEFRLQFKPAVSKAVEQLRAQAEEQGLQRLAAQQERQKARDERIQREAEELRVKLKEKEKEKEQTTTTLTISSTNGRFASNTGRFKKDSTKSSANSSLKLEEGESGIDSVEKSVELLQTDQLQIASSKSDTENDIQTVLSASPEDVKNIIDIVMKTETPSNSSDSNILIQKRQDFDQKSDLQPTQPEAKRMCPSPKHI